MTYTSTIEEINSTRRKFKIHVPADSVQKAFSSALNKVQKKVKIRGFREGKVPPALVRQFHMHEIAKEAADEVVQKAYSECVKQADFQVVSHPHIEPENQFEENKDFEFSAIVDINPKVEIKDYKGLNIKLDENFNKNLDEEVENLLGSYSRVFGKREKVEADRPVEKGDFANISYHLYIDGKENSQKEVKNQSVEINGTHIPEIENALVGMKAGESKVFPVTFAADYRDQDLQGKQAEIHLTLNAIETFTPAVLNDELAQKIGYSNFEDAMKQIRDMVHSTHSRMKTNSALEQVINSVLEKNDFEVAESLIDNSIDRIIAEENSRLPKEQQLDAKDESTRKTFFDDAKKQVRGVLALGHIARQENITVSDDEMFQELSNFAMRNRIDPRVLIKQVGNQIFDEFRGQVMMHKVVEFILNHGHIEYSKFNDNEKSSGINS